MKTDKEIESAFEKRKKWFIDRIGKRIYISLLNEEINGLVGIAYVRGWKSNLVEQGKQARERIESLLKSLPNKEATS